MIIDRNLHPDKTATSRGFIQALSAGAQARRNNTTNSGAAVPQSLFTLSAGFTLVEMVVTVGVFAIISMLIIVRNASFDNEVLLNSLAYDIALSVRQAQQFGVNVRVSNTQFLTPYGVHFVPGTNTYTMFTDVNSNNIYNQGTDAVVETFTIGRGATVDKVCNIETSVCNLTFIDVVFKRPDPDAVITANTGALSRGRVELRSARKDGIRYIDIESTGQISIGKPTDQ